MLLSVLFPAGILNDDGTLNNDASCLRLAEVALAYAQAGKSCFVFFKVVSIFWKKKIKQLAYFSFSSVSLSFLY